jgi:hypothetical protein
MSQFDGLLDIKTKEKRERGSSQKREKKTLPTPPPAEKKRDDKQPGKSKNPEFVQTSIYIKKETQISVKSQLLTDQKNRDFSELVEELLSDWLSGKVSLKA